MTGKLLRLSLTDFRSYGALVWRPRARLGVIVGPNGSGKTNLLEAVSLLAPGRGLRGARVGDLARREGPGTWAVAGRFGPVNGAFGDAAFGNGAFGDGAFGDAASGEGAVDVGTGTPPGGPADRRVFRLDGAAPRTLAQVAEHVGAVWLTPQMDRLFQDAASGRRRFLDRLVFALEPAHARELAAHDTAVAQRNRLLADRRDDPAWLDAVEDSIARHAVSVTAARAGLALRLNAAADAEAAFPPARVGLLCPIADRLAEHPALAAEDWLRSALAGARRADAAAGATSFGAHRADMALADAASGMPASVASTGQQKALLLGVILGHAALIAGARGSAPLLLLDEPLVHLDAARRHALFAALRRLPAQTLLTGTDSDVFLGLRGEAELLVAGGGALRPDPAFGL